MAESTSKIPEAIIFMPGASGDGAFWQGVGRLLPQALEKHYLNWPGLGNQPHDQHVKGFSDLVLLAEKALSRPSIIVAQSMGGIVAVELARRLPERVTHLVLAATSGGLDVSSYGGADWREAFFLQFPRSVRWVAHERPDLRQAFRDLKMPTLLLWGGADEISPLAVGEFLAREIPHAKLVVIPEGDHCFGIGQPEVVASHIKRHLVDIEICSEVFCCQRSCRAE